MDATNTNQYQNLGNKVFWLYFLQSSPAAIILFIVSIAVFAVSSQNFLATTPFGNIQSVAQEAAAIILLLAVVIAGIAFLISWLTYINYKFLMAEDSFKIQRGILNKAQDAIPYKQIQNVDIERPFTFLIFGLSRLVILTAGHEDEKEEEGDEAEGVIPAIDKKLAEWLQTELLKKADIQKTIQMDATSTPPPSSPNPAA